MRQLAPERLASRTDRGRSRPVANEAATSRRGRLDQTAEQVPVGNYTDFTATRAAFRLGLTGPALTVSTACANALVSVHLACQALRAGDADLMLVGSAALHLPQVSGHVPVKGSTLSTGTVRQLSTRTRTARSAVTGPQPSS
ncbi:hypothetical protein SBADM41S_11844 [Streptomyces badius]